MASGDGSSSGAKFDIFRNKVGTVRPQETTRLLFDSARIAQETEAIGGNTHKEMIKQRESLQRTAEQVHSMTQIAQTAKSSIRQIHERLFMKKIFLWSIMLVLLAANVALLLVLIQNHGKLFITTK